MSGSMYHLTSERRRLILVGSDFDSMEKIAESAWIFFDSHSVGIKIDIAVKADRALTLMKYYEYDLAILCIGTGSEWEWPKFVKGLAGKERRFPFLVYTCGKKSEVGGILKELKPDTIVDSGSLKNIPSLIDETILKSESAKMGSGLISTLRESIVSIKSVKIGRAHV